MWELGHNNWIKYGWGPELSSSMENPLDRLHVDFTNFDNTKTILSPSESAIDAVYKIVENYPAPYTLMCSGGRDSQTMILSWLAAGVPFEIMSVRYISDNIFFNEYDLITLEGLSKLHGLNIIYQDLDIISFLENELSEINKLTEVGSPQYATHIKFSDFVPIGTILYSGNTLGADHAQLGYHGFGLHRHAINIETETKKIIPFFFLHTPDLAYSALNNRKIKDDNIFPIVHRPADKFNGFEKIKEYYDKYFKRVTPAHKLKGAGYPSTRVFDLLFRYPYYAYGKVGKGKTIEFIIKRVL
jgi:hypothetical protein